MLYNVIYAILLTSSAAVEYLLLTKIYKNKKLNQYISTAKASGTYSEEYEMKYSNYLNMKCAFLTITSIILVLATKFLGTIQNFLLATIAILIVEIMDKNYEVPKE